MEIRQGQGRTLWVDVGTLVGWRGNATGIARTLTQLLQYWMADERLQVRLCRYDLVHRAYRTVDPAQLRTSRPAATAAEETASRHDSAMWNFLSKIYVPGEALEAFWHLGQAARWFGRLGHSVFCRGVRVTQRMIARVRQPVHTTHFSPGDVLFIGGVSWKDSPIAAKLQAIKQKHGLKVVNLIYDITPLRCPHLCAPHLSHTWEKWLPGMLGCTDLVMTISEHSRKDIVDFARQHAVAMPPIEKLRLGDEPSEDDGEQAPGDLLAKSPGPFVLYVSTIGLHKNHQLLFHVWRRLIERHGGGVPTLVLVGGQGWRDEQLLRYLKTDAVLSRHVVHLAKTNDRQLRWLYRRCLFTLYPSLYEGWGLPVAESLALGKYCISSNATSLPEVGGNLVDYHDPLDGPTCQALIEKALLEPGWLASREDRIRREYRPTTWRECAKQTFEILDRHFELTSRPALREAA